MFKFSPKAPPVSAAGPQPKNSAKQRWKRLQEYILQKKYKNFMTEYQNTQKRNDSRKAGRLRIPSGFLFDDEDTASDKFTKAVFYQIQKLRLENPSNTVEESDEQKQSKSTEKKIELEKDKEAFEFALRSIVYPLLDHRNLVKSFENVAEARSKPDSNPNEYSAQVVSHLNKLIGNKHEAEVVVPLKVSPLVFGALKERIKSLLQKLQEQNGSDQIYFKCLFQFFNDVIKKRAGYVIAAGSTYDDLVSVFMTLVSTELKRSINDQSSEDALKPYASINESILARMILFSDLIKESVEDACTQEIAKRQKEKNAPSKRYFGLGHKRQKTQPAASIDLGRGQGRSRSIVTGNVGVTSLQANLDVFQNLTDNNSDMPQDIVIMTEWLKEAFFYGRSLHEELLRRARDSNEPDDIVTDFTNRIQQIEADLRNDISSPTVFETYGVSEKNFTQLNPALYLYWRKRERQELLKFKSRAIKLYCNENPDNDDQDVDNGNIKKVSNDNTSILSSSEDISKKKKWFNLKKEVGESVKLRIRIIEAKGLAGKDEGGTSDPYCVLEHGSKQRYETNVVSKTVFPLWDQEVVIETKTSSSKPIKVTVWDKDEEEKLSSPLSVKFWKDEADDFLGQLVLSVPEVLKDLKEASGKRIDKWFVLQRRSKRSHISGEIRLAIEEETENNEQKNETDSVPESQEVKVVIKENVRILSEFTSHRELYRYLLEKLLTFDSMNTVGDDGEGSLSLASRSILDELGERWRLSKVWRELCYFEIMSKRYMHPTSTNLKEDAIFFNPYAATSIDTLARVYKKLDQIFFEARDCGKSIVLISDTKIEYAQDGTKMVTPPVLQGQGEYIATCEDIFAYDKLLKEITEYQKWQIQRYKDCFPCDTPKGSLTSTLSMLHTIFDNEKSTSTKKSSDSGLNIPDESASATKFVDVVEDLIKTGALERFQRLSEMAMPSVHNPAKRLVQLASLIMEEMDSDKIYFQGAFAADADILAIVSSVYFKYFILEIQVLVADMLPSKSRPVVQTPPELFDLYYRVQDMQERYVSYLEKTPAGRIVKAEFSLHTWFSPCIHNWLLNSSDKLLSWVDNAIDADKLEPIDKHSGVLHSSSVLDLFSYLNQMYEFLNKLNWKEAGGLRFNSLTEVELANERDSREFHWCLFLTRFSRTVQYCLAKYCDIISKRISDDKIKYEKEVLKSKNFTLDEALGIGKTKDKQAKSAQHLVAQREWISSGHHTENVCTQVNNIEACRVQLNELYDKIGVDNIQEFVEKYRQQNAMLLKKSQQKLNEIKNSRLMDGCLTISIVSAENLVALDSNGASDPYCVVSVAENKTELKGGSAWTSMNPWKSQTETENLRQLAKTRIISETLNPKWDETFTAILTNAEELNIAVYDYDVLSRDDVCGTCSISLEKLSKLLQDGLTHEIWLDLKPQGKLCLRLQLEKSYAKLNSSDMADIDYYFRKSLRELKRCSSDLTDLLSESMTRTMTRELVKILKEAEKTGKQGLGEQEHFSIMKVFNNNNKNKSLQNEHHQHLRESLVQEHEVANAVQNLTEYLNDTLSILSSNLYPRLSKDLFKKVWNQLLTIVDNLLLPSLYGDQAIITVLNRTRPLTERQIEMTASVVQVLKLFFYADGSPLGLPLQTLETQMYMDVKTLMELYWLDLNDLLKMYPAVLQDYQSRKKESEHSTMNPDYLLRLIRLRMNETNNTSTAKSFFLKQMQEREQRLRWNPELNGG